MKYNVLRSIAHNIADSLASGAGLLIGVYSTDIFGEARENKNGFITVDFLNGTTTGGTLSLMGAVGLYRDALPDLCEKQKVLVTDFRKLIAHYSFGFRSVRVVVEVEDKNGRSSIDEYIDLPLRRIKSLDAIGRVRVNPTKIQRRLSPPPTELKVPAQ